tara:strand:- start:74 stop:8053 length:7980 start_codon:yes stop_codon:yes gene_type:complete
MESHQLYFGSTFRFDEDKIVNESDGTSYILREEGEACGIQLESERDTAGNANLMFTLGETLTGETSGSTAVVTGTKGNTIAFIKSTSRAMFDYGEKVTGSISRSYGTLANGIVDGTFPEGSVESYRSRAPAAAIRELEQSQDIDTTCSGLIDDAWKKEFYTNVPKTTQADRRQLLKRMIQVYRSKGNEASFGWLFRTIFDKEDIEFYYPKTDMLKMSDGRWALDKSIKIVTSGANNITLFTGRKITGQLSKCTAIVESQLTEFAGALEVTELTLSDVVQGVVDDELFFFKPNELITSETDIDGLYAEAVTSGILQTVTVDVGGTNYIVGDEIHVTGGGGQGARARVASILDSVVEGINVIDSGDGYAVGDVIDFINDGTGGSGAAGQIQTIISTGAILRNTDLISAFASKLLSSADYVNTFSEHNANTHLYGNSSLIFSAGIKSVSAKLYNSQGAYDATQHILAGDRIAKQVSVNTSGVTLTQSVKTVTLSTGLSENEKIDIVGGKLTYANANTTLITGFSANNVLLVRDEHTIGAGQTFSVDYASNTYWGTVISANTTAFLYSVGSYYRDSDIDALTVQNFVNDDNIIVYDSKFTKLGAAADASRDDSHNMHNGVTFQVGNTPAAVTTNTFTMVDAHGALPDLELVCNGALNMTSVNVGAIDAFVLTSGGGKYETSPPVSVANSYTPTLGNALDVTGAPNALLNLNLHSFTSGTIEQDGNVVTLTSDDSIVFPDANSGVLTLTYANGATDEITEVTNSSVIRVTSEKLFGVGTGDNPDKETFSLSYMALANNIAPNSLLYNDDYSARGRVLDFIDNPTLPTQNPYIANGNTTIRVDMLTTQDFGGVIEHILLEGKDFHKDVYSHQKLLLEHPTIGSQHGGGGIFLTEDCVEFLVMEDDDLICNESDESRFYSEVTTGDRVTAYSNGTTTYTTGTIAQSGTTVTGVGTIFPNDFVRGTITYSGDDDTTSIITGYTNATSFTVEDSKTVSAGNTYSITYNPVRTWGINREITLAAGGTGNRTVTVTEEAHYLRSGDKVKITGSGTEIFNGIYPITVANNTTYTYTLPEDTGVTSPSGEIRSRPVSSVWLSTSNAVSMDTSPKGNNAIIEVSAIAIGAIQSAEVYDFGAGYSSVPALSTTSGDQNAELTAGLGAYATYPGYYTATQGLLSGVPKLQDNKYYQNFSYVLKTDFDVNDFRNSVKRLIHPSGLIMFGELAIRTKVSAQMFDAATNNVDDIGTIVQEGLDNYGKKYHTIVLTQNAATANAQYRSTNTQPEFEIYTARHPWQAMDARLETADEQNLQLEDFRDITSIVRSNSTMYVVTEYLHGLEAGDTIKISGDESGQQFNNKYTVTTSPTTNTYTVTPSPDHGGDVDQNMYDGYLYVQLEDFDTGNNVLMEDGNELLMEPSAYLKSEITAFADVFRADATNWDSPFAGNLQNEDDTEILLERGGSYLYPSIQFPEAESGVISIDVSFNSDVLLEDDNGTYGWGYLLDENSGALGTGPQRFISLEEDTQGPDHQYESIPIVDTHVMETWFNSARDHLISENGIDRFMHEDEGLLTLDTIPITYDASFTKHIRNFAHYNCIVAEDGSPLINEESIGPIGSNTYFTVEDEYGLRQNKRTDLEFDLVESLNWHLLMEDENHFAQEVDETRFLTEESIVKVSTREIKPHLYDTMGYHVRMENEDYLEHEDGTLAIIEANQVGVDYQRIEYNLYETIYWHIMQEDGVTHTSLEDGTRLTTEDFNLKATSLLQPPVKNIYGVDTMGWHIELEDASLLATLSRVDITVTAGGSGPAFIFDGTEAAVLTLTGQRTYRFIMEHSSLRPSETEADWHPLRFSKTQDGEWGPSGDMSDGGEDYTEGVTVNGEPGVSGSYVEFTPTNLTQLVYYFCDSHSGMGAELHIVAQDVSTQYLAMEDFHKDLGQVNLSRILQDIPENKAPDITKRYVTEEAPSDMQRWTPANHELDYIETWQDTVVTRTFGMQPFRPHYVSNWADAELSFVDEKFTQEDDSGVILLEHPVTNQNYLLAEDFPELNQDVLNLQRELLDGILLEDSLQTLGTIDGRQYDYIQLEEMVEHQVISLEDIVPAFGNNPGDLYSLNGIRQAPITMERFQITRFDMSHSTVIEHPIALSTTEDGTHGGGVEFTSGMTADRVTYNVKSLEDIVPPFGNNPGDLFDVDGVQKPEINFSNRNQALRIEVSDATMSEHPVALSTTSDGTHNSGVAYTAGQVSANSTFIVESLEDITDPFGNNPGDLYAVGLQGSALTQQPTLIFPNRLGVIRFDTSDSTLSEHPFRLSTTSDGTHNGGVEYTTGKTIVGTPGQNGSYTDYVLSRTTPNTLYYYCHTHEGMGNSITVAQTSYYEWKFDINTPNTLYYYCTSHEGMGNQINIAEELYAEYYLGGDAPDLLYYYCEMHEGMGNKINVVDRSGNKRALLETAKPVAEGYGVEYTPTQAWSVLPAYRYSRILTRMKGTISFSHMGTTGTGSGSEFTEQLRVGEEFQTLDENIIDEDSGGGILLETDERIEAEEIRIIHVQNEDLAQDLLGCQIRNFRWLITTEDTTVAAHGTHAGVTGEYSAFDTSAESFWITTDATNQALIVGLNHEVGVLEQETPDWENINMLWEDGSKMTVIDAQAFIVKTITNDLELEVTRKHIGGTDNVTYQL